MSWMLILIYACVFALVCGFSYWALSSLMPSGMTQRLDSLKDTAPPERSASWQKWLDKVQQAMAWLGPLSSASEPEDPAQTFRLRLRFYNAGIHSRLAPFAETFATVSSIGVTQTSS